MGKIKHALLLILGVFSLIPAYSQTRYDTTCTNLLQVNSTFDDYLPFLVDSMLLFTSNRRNTLEGQTLEFTEKVYWSVKKDKKWSEARKDGYKWNSDNNTALVGVGPANYYFYRAYWKDNGEIFIAPRKADTIDPWRAKPLKKFSEVCSDFDENSITTAKEDTFYFVSNRNGNNDIFMQTGEEAPVTVNILNSANNEQDVFIAKDGKTIYFSSDRVGGKGGFDIYHSTKVNGQWTTPDQEQFKYANTEADDRDFRLYNDSTAFLSSNRANGMGGFDIYEITVKSFPPPPPVIQQERVELIEQLKTLDIDTFRCELQLGAYRYIKSIEAFKKTFKCIEDEDLRIDTLYVDNQIVYKYIVNRVYTDVNEALDKQFAIIVRSCLPDKDFVDMPFIGILDKNGKRYAIFWRKDEFETKKVFNIFSEGKMVWKGRRF
jgi:hypothetical protein